MQLKVVLAAVFVTAASSIVTAQVEVIDRPVGSAKAVEASRTRAQQGSGPVSGSSQNQAEVFYQLQLLQEEVLQLRGQVEEQANELRKLKQQRLDDYLDLDRRLSEISRGGGGSMTRQNPAPQSSSTSASSTSVVGGDPAPEDELKSYRAAMEYIFTEDKRDYVKATDALTQHLAQYPKGRYAANAQYWLGEIYLKDNDIEKARYWFGRLLADFPDHAKAPDAKFKLGKVFDMLGDKVQAKRLLEEVVQSGSNAAKLAREYLDTHFSS